jgi:hypothetical protein
LKRATEAALSKGRDVKERAPRGARRRGGEWETGGLPGGDGQGAVDATRVIAEHRRVFSLLNAAALKAIEMSRAEGGMEELKRMKAAVDLFAAIVRGERLVWGIEEKGADCLTDEIEDIAEEMEALTIPSGADEALD